jgi:hypothetical protein
MQRKTIAPHRQVLRPFREPKVLIELVALRTMSSPDNDKR